MRVAEIVGSIARSGGHLRVLDDGNLEYAGSASGATVRPSRARPAAVKPRSSASSVRLVEVAD